MILRRRFFPLGSHCDRVTLHVQALYEAKYLIWWKNLVFLKFWSSSFWGVHGDWNREANRPRYTSDSTLMGQASSYWLESTLIWFLTLINPCRSTTPKKSSMSVNVQIPSNPPKTSNALLVSYLSIHSDGRTGLCPDAIYHLLFIIETRDAHFPVFQFPVGKREIWPISRSGKTGKSGKIVA